MKLTNLMALIAFTFMSLGSIAAHAEQKIAIINIQKIMRDSLAAKSVKQKLEAKQKSFQSEMASKEKSLQSEEKGLIQQKSVLSKEEFEKKVKGFQQTAVKAQRDVQQKKSKLDKAFADSLSKIQETVVGIAEKIAKEKGYSMVMPTSQMLYADPSLDITAQTLTALNSQLPSVKVSF